MCDVAGDAFHKPCISGEPDVETFKYETGDWLVLACDGLWDQLTYDDVAELLSDESDTSSTPARRLVLAARDQGSSDNITAIAVRLAAPPNVKGRDASAPTDPNRTAEVKADEKTGGGEAVSRADAGTESASCGESHVGGDTVIDCMETSRLAMSMKRLADTELEVRDIDVKQTFRLERKMFYQTCAACKPAKAPPLSAMEWCRPLLCDVICSECVPFYHCWGDGNAE